MSLGRVTTKASPMVRAGDGPGVIVNRDLQNPILWSPDNSITSTDNNSFSILDPLVGLPVTGDIDIYGLAGNNAVSIIFDFIPGALNWNPSPVQIAEQIALIKLQIQLNGFNAVTPTGDTTGIADTAAIIAAMASSPMGTVILADGSYYVLSNQLQFGVGTNGTKPRPVSLIHLGDKSACRIFQVGGAGYTIWCHNDTNTYAQNSWATFAGITVDLTMAQAGAVGWDIGDIGQIFLNDCDCHTDSDATKIPWNFANRYFFTEQLHGSIHVSGNPGQAVVFDCIPALAVGSQATGSFERPSLDIYVNTQLTTDDVTWQNGAFMAGGGHVSIQGNHNGGAIGAPGSVLTITGQTPGTAASASFSNVQKIGSFNVNVENTAGGAIAPITITFAANINNFLVECNGNINFDQSHGFQSAVGRIANAQFSFLGNVTGDDTLLAQVGAGGRWSVITTGFPAGITGQIRFMQYDITGLCFILFELAVANGTVLTQGEVIVAAGTLPPKLTPNNNQSAAFILNDPSTVPALSPLVLTVTSAGGITCNNARTLGAAGNISGAHTYPNSI